MRFFILFMLFFSLGQNIQARDFCADYLMLVSEKDANNTNAFIAYINKLEEEGILDSLQLQSMLGHLKQGNQLINPVPHQKLGDQTLFSRAQYEIHYNNIQTFIETNFLDKKKILAWLEITLEQKRNVHQNKNQAEQQTQSIFMQMKFQPLPPAEFVMKHENLKSVEVKLTHATEVMTTPVTQWMWVELMGVNPSQFRTGESSIIVDYEGRSIMLKPDNPVENITWYAAIEFANRLSIARGLRPAYDLTGLKALDGSKVEDGSLYFAHGSKIKVNHSSGDIYQAEGYRLPTEAEQYYLLNLVQSNLTNFPQDLRNLSWHSGNSNQQTHPVDELGKQLTVFGQNFYSLFGNVGEWSNDVQLGYLSGGVNPAFTDGTGSRLYRGGSWKSITLEGLLRRSASTASSRSNDRGFRLVRTLK